MNISSCFEKATATFKANAVPLTFGALVLFVTNAGIGILNRYIPGASLLGIVATAPLSGGLMLMALRARRGAPVDVPQIFDGFNRAVPFIVVNLVIGAGALACGVGVLVTAFFFMFATVFVALGDEHGRALTRSKDIALAHVSETALLIAVLVGLNLAGALLCGVGLLVTIPLSSLLVLEGLEQLAPGTVR